MKKLEGVCQKCGKISKLTRDYCSSTCYKQLMRSGEIQKIPKPVSPSVLTLEQEEILVGSMLGDGCVFKHPKSKHPYFYVARKMDDIEYLEYEFQKFRDFCNQSEVKIIDIVDKRNGRKYQQCKFVTRASDVFEPFYKQWYNDVKVLPPEIKLTPLVCAIWFCDDGNVSRNKTCNTIKFKLATHCFTFEENQRLADMLKAMFQEHFGVGCDDGNHFIFASDSGTKKFIKYIEPVFPQSMSRKKRWTEQDFLKSKSPSHLKYRNKLNLNEKELAVFSALENGQFLNPKAIAEKMNWKAKGSKTPTGLFLYLDRFYSYEWVTKTGTPHSYKDPISYGLTDKGFEVIGKVKAT